MKDKLRNLGMYKEKCEGCNNIKGCITCVDGSEWAHYEEVDYSVGMAADSYVGHSQEIDEDPSCYIRREAFKEGVKFAKKNAWKDASGDVLPEFEKEVVAIVIRNNESELVFAYRPNPDGWDGRNIETGEITRYEPKCYDKGGWNIPDVRWWLDVSLPK